MADYVLTQRADQDIAEIYRFSYQQFGAAKADAYLLALEERFLMLAEQPLIGQKIDHIRVRFSHAQSRGGKTGTFGFWRESTNRAKK